MCICLFSRNVCALFRKKKTAENLLFSVSLRKACLFSRFISQVRFDMCDFLELLQFFYYREVS